jgi:hypothetical protein
VIEENRVKILENVYFKLGENTGKYNATTRNFVIYSHIDDQLRFALA